MAPGRDPILLASTRVTTYLQDAKTVRREGLRLCMRTRGPILKPVRSAGQRTDLGRPAPAGYMYPSRIAAPRERDYRKGSQWCSPRPARQACIPPAQPLTPLASVPASDPHTNPVRRRLRHTVTPSTHHLPVGRPPGPAPGSAPTTTLRAPPAICGHYRDSLRGVRAYPRDNFRRSPLASSNDYRLDPAPTYLTHTITRTSHRLLVFRNSIHIVGSHWNCLDML